MYTYNYEWNYTINILRSRFHGRFANKTVKTILRVIFYPHNIIHKMNLEIRVFLL